VRRPLTTALALALLLVFACGRKTAPKAPELVRPEAITSLAAENKPDGIVLTWRRPSRYVDGSRMRDLGSFLVERAAGDAPFAPLATLAVTDRDRFRQIRHFRYLDGEVRPDVRYRYRIVTRTTDGYESVASNVAESLRTAVAPPTPPP
jgi:hypothetical protein